MARIIVIGSGVAGLAAAARMASAANEVTLVERNADPGGALTWAGPWTLTLPAVLRDLFVKTGGRKASSGGALEDVVDLRPVDPVRTYVFPDGARLALPNAARGATKEAFDGMFGAGAGDAWLRLIDHGNRAWGVIRPTLVEVPDAGRAELWRLIRSSATRRAITPRRSLRQIAADAGVHDPRMLRILDEYAIDAGADPAKAPAIVSIRPYLEHAFGAWRIVGGMPTLIDAMFERCVKRGVTFRFEAEAARVEPGSVTLASGERLSADVIVAAVDISVLERLTGEKGAAGREYSPAVCAVRLAGPADATLPHESVLFGTAGTAGAAGAAGTAGAVRTAGTASGATIRLHTDQEQPGSWVAHIDALSFEEIAGGAEGVVREVARRLGLSAEAVTATATYTAADWERRTGVPGGSAHGPVSNSFNEAILRAPTVHPQAAGAGNAKGLLHIGGSTRPGPGIAFAALSSWNAAEVLKPTRI